MKDYEKEYMNEHARNMQLTKLIIAGVLLGLTITGACNIAMPCCRREKILDATNK
jgi:hypothetical protein